MLRRVVVTLVATGVVVALAGSPASAQTKVRADPRGDSPARTDITGVKVQNTADRFAVTVRLADVRPGRTAVAFGSGRTPNAQAGFLVDVFPVSKGRFSTRVIAGAGEEEAAPLRCPAARTTVKAGRRGYVRVVLPQSCLGALAGRQSTDVISYDKRALGGDVSSDVSAAERGDLSDELAFDFVSTVTTRRG
ncbi:MAG: hypothetical protein Q7T56_01555 [Nocardioidaceae bacterium]|nr:hypothetical protein [Nocardioidaceae bacterium]